jgi:hypothetical protein
MVNAGKIIIAFVLVGGLLAGCGTRPVSDDSEHADVAAQRQTPDSGQRDRVLFVGNSLTYYGNTPAVFSALADANGRSVVSDMIVAGGASLTQRVSDGSVARALEERQYKALVLQERGGTLICLFGPDSCTQSRASIKALSALATDKDVQAVLLGSYQGHPEISRSLVEAEWSAAAEAGIPYIEVSGKLQRLTETLPELSWFADDGAHPGKHLALLNAILVHEAVFGSLPDPRSLVIKAPIYAGNTGLDGSLRKADAPPPRADMPGEVRYSSETLAKVLGALSGEE